ncbi:PAAR domain-containing protein [Aquabacterium sp.]|uniref:PAAR domain-containing protein n=1 Tax=Aquabacterium sp. TaxID=1872578 RepID=UPI00351D0A21
MGVHVTCPGSTVIFSGDPTMIIDGMPAARHGDKCARGATLISSQFVSVTSDGGAANPQAASAAQAAGAAHLA